MKILGLSEKDIREDFESTDLPEESYARYRKYLSDLDTYYYLRDEDSPRMQERILERAFVMTNRYLHSISQGHSEKLADSFARQFAYSPDSYIQQDQFRFLSKYCNDNGYTDFSEIIKEIDNSVILDKISSITFNKATNIKHIPTCELALYLASDPTLDTETLQYLVHKDKFKSVPQELGQLLSESIFSLEKLIRNKHLRRHAKVWANRRFVVRKVIVHIGRAEEIYAKCSELMEDDYPLTFTNDTTYLFCLIEAVKDIYRIFDK